MPTPTLPVAPGAPGQPAPQAAPRPRSGTPPRVTHALAERHEALWLSLTALHKNIAALAAKKPAAPVSETIRIAAEGLLADTAPFVSKLRQRLPVAAPDLAGLAVQLGQALALLDAWEAANSQWRADLNAFVWRVKGEEPLPVQRLRPKLSAAPTPAADPDYAAYQARTEDLRQKLAIRIAQFKQR